MGTTGSPRESESCPFLVRVMDLPWSSALAVSCQRPGYWSRAPEADRLTCICRTRAHLVCPGYLASVGSRLAPAEPKSARAAPPTG